MVDIITTHKTKPKQQTMIRQKITVARSRNSIGLHGPIAVHLAASYDEPRENHCCTAKEDLVISAAGLMKVKDKALSLQKLSYALRSKSQGAIPSTEKQSCIYSKNLKQKQQLR
jgi:hypothetical protein